MQKERSRKIVTMGPTKVVGKFPSMKSGKIHEWESQLERDRMYQHEMDASVIVFQEQPETISLAYDGRAHRYTPDLWVERTSGITVEEVKPADKVEKYAALLDAAEEHYADRGISFIVVTEETIRQQPYLNNIKILARYRQWKIDRYAVDVLHDMFAHGRALTFSDFENHLIAAGHDPLTACACLAQGLVKTDLGQPFNRTSLVTLDKGAPSCLQ